MLNTNITNICLSLKNVKMNKNLFIYSTIGLFSLFLAAFLCITLNDDKHLPQKTVTEIKNAVDEIIYNFENGNEGTKFRYAKGLLTMQYNWEKEGIYNIHRPIIKPYEYEDVKEHFDIYYAYRDSAYKYIECMAHMGNSEYQYTLGLFHLGVNKNVNTRFAVPQDMSKAALWLRNAAEQDHPSACFLYGDLFYMIEYYPKDIGQAKYWWEKAASNGCFAAKQRLQWMQDNNKLTTP